MAAGTATSCHVLTQVVDNVVLAPFTPETVLLLRRAAGTGAQKKIINLVGAEVSKGLRGECFDLLEVGAVKLQDGNGVAGAVIVDSLVSALRPGDVPRADDDSVRLGFGKELTDDLEALELVLG